MAPSSSATTSPRRFIAIDIGGTKIASAIVELASPLPLVRNKSEVPTPARSGSKAVVEAVFESVRRCLALENEAPAAIGIASAGVVNTETGAIISATDLIKGWAGTPLAKLVEEEFGLPVDTLNDVHAHALGECTYGAGKEYGSVLAVAVGTGIGGAIVADGKLHMGAHFAAGHVGHVPHPLAAGFPCSCGASGHIESVASGTGQVDLYNARTSANEDQAKSGREITQRAQAGEALATQVLADSGAGLGDAIAGIANCVDPQAVVLSGSVTRSGEIWWSALKNAFQAGALPILKEIEILEGTLGSDAPLLGATTWAASKLEGVENER